MVPRAWGIGDIFIRPFDSAFQESLALAHLKYGLSVTYGISGFGIYDGSFLFHASHPPLLQLIYAALYAIFGVHEWVSRSFCTLAAVGTALCIWASLNIAGARKASFPAALFFALAPLSVEIGRTTNYEPGALLFISLFALGYTLRAKRSGIALMTVSALVGGFFEWTVYLVLPASVAACFIEERSLKKVKFIIAPAMAAALALGTVLLWQYWAVGSIPMLGHAHIRSDPRALLDLGVFNGHLMYPLKSIGPGWIIVAAGLFFLIPVYRKTPGAAGLLAIFVFTPLLFIITAPQLVLTHRLSSLYVVPAVCMLISLPAEKIKPRIMLTAAVALLSYYSVVDARLVGQRAPFFRDLASYASQRIEGDECRTFDSAAVGYTRYYHGMETFHAVGANEPPVDVFAQDERICAFLLDVEHPEVKYVKEAVAREKDRGGLRMAAKLHGTELWLRGGGDNSTKLANILDQAEPPPRSDKWWENPSAELIDAYGETRFGILHHPRADGESVINFRGLDAEPGGKFFASAMLDPEVCGNSKSDGVTFRVNVSARDWSEKVVGTIIPQDGRCEPVPVSININTIAGTVDVELTVEPGGGPDYDRFFWDDPRIEINGGDRWAE